MEFSFKDQSHNDFLAIFDIVKRLWDIYTTYIIIYLSGSPFAVCFWMSRGFGSQGHRIPLNFITEATTAIPGIAGCGPKGGCFNREFLRRDAMLLCQSFSMLSPEAWVLWWFWMTLDMDFVWKTCGPKNGICDVVVIVVEKFLALRKLHLSSSYLHRISTFNTGSIMGQSWVNPIPNLIQGGELMGSWSQGSVWGSTTTGLQFQWILYHDRWPATGGIFLRRLRLFSIEFPIQ